ncbi:MAG: histidine kinase [Rhodoferax sp.]|uniref:sensor histidine kinase n=1 Tax=Rhodoferax sp. TaxID=50421 RepID=UPI00260A7DC1|nr:histidine kinase [Rhodoferax sp.]MDD5335291.1 histidine kinase [Rhodoferax sp.]
MTSKTVERWAALTLLQHSLPSLTINTVIALSLTAFGDGDFATNLVYSHCIGISIWLLIEVGLHFLMPNRKQQWRRLYLIVPLAVTAGYLVGLYTAAWLMGHQTEGIWSEHPRLVLGYLLMSLAAGGAMSYYFLSREQLAAAREDTAQAAAQTETAQRQATESKLLLLQSQLEPHMLFNTLANLRALIGTNPVAATDMLDRLNAYLRATLSASRASSHSVRAEFDRLHDYLELMAVRMGPRLRYTLDLPPELAELAMPPLLLQPLVENAIKHGLEPKVEGGSITVRARLAAGRLTLEVQDSGVGLPAGAATAQGFGLAQVRERLATSYGAQGTLELTAGAAAGTSVSVTFPSEP